MYKLCLFALLVSSARAGLIGGIGLGHGVVASPVAVAPVAVAAPAVAVAHGATSYQNSNSISLNPTVVVAKVAHPVAAAPLAVAAPVAHPFAVGVAPVGLGLGYGAIGKGLAYGLH